MVWLENTNDLSEPDEQPQLPDNLFHPAEPNTEKEHYRRKTFHPHFQPIPEAPCNCKYQFPPVGKLPFDLYRVILRSGPTDEVMKDRLYRTTPDP